MRDRHLGPLLAVRLGAIAGLVTATSSIRVPGQVVPSPLGVLVPMALAITGVAASQENLRWMVPRSAARRLRALRVWCAALFDLGPLAVILALDAVRSPTDPFALWLPTASAAAVGFGWISASLLPRVHWLVPPLVASLSVVAFRTEIEGFLPWLTPFGAVAVLCGGAFLHFRQGQ